MTRAEDTAGETEERVGPLELFFDLVFVFAITQVTAYMAGNAGWSGLGRGLMLLALVWWAWVAYSWLTNSVDTERDRERLTLLAAMTAMFVVALAIPSAFRDDAVLFAVAYVVVRSLHIVLYVIATDDVDEALAAARLGLSVAAAGTLLLTGAGVQGRGQVVLWALAIVIDYAGPVLGGMHGWRLHAGHFAERHGLIVIIALGESLVATGAGAADIALSTRVIFAAGLAMAVTACLWWAYFDVVAPVAEKRLRDAAGIEQVRLARDSYSYLHFLMIAGIVLFALGAKHALADVDDDLSTVGAVALLGGVAVYLLGHIAFRLRNLGTLNRQRLVAAAVALALVPVAREVSAFTSLALLTLLTVSLIAFEALYFRDSRRKVRDTVHPSH